MFKINFGAILMAVAVVFATQQLEAQIQRQAAAVTSLTHNINPNPISPFFSQATGDDGTVYDFAPIGGISGDLVSGAGDTTNVSGTITIVGTSNSSTNFNDGNRLPKGVTLTYDLSFTISTTDGELLRLATFHSPVRLLTQALHLPPVPYLRLVFLSSVPTTLLNLLMESLFPTEPTRLDLVLRWVRLPVK